MNRRCLAIAWLLPLLLAVGACVNALCTCRIATVGEDDHGAIHTVHIGRDGRALLDVGQQSSVSAQLPSPELPQ